MDALALPLPSTLPLAGAFCHPPGGWDAVAFQFHVSMARGTHCEDPALSVGGRYIKKSVKLSLTKTF